MLIKVKKASGDRNEKGCLACGRTDLIKNRRYCSIQCRQHLRQKLNTRSGLLEALNVRYATFYFTDRVIVLDVVCHGVREIFRFAALRTAGCKPADDFGKMSNLLGNAWWAEEQRTHKGYMASRHVLDMAERLAMSEGMKRPRLIRSASVKPEHLTHLGMLKTDLTARDPARLIKNAYRRQVKIHHPDAGGHASTFRAIHDAYRAMLRWADHPSFIRRRGFADKWYYDHENKKWVQPLPEKK